MTQAKANRGALGIWYTTDEEQAAGRVASCSTDDVVEAILAHLKLEVEIDVETNTPILVSLEPKGPSEYDDCSCGFPSGAHLANCTIWGDR